MAREQQRGPRGPTVPPDVPVTPPPPLPSGDYCYTLEVVMGMQGAIGKMTEAVDGLKAQTKGHGEKLGQIGKDIHAAKAVILVVGGIIAIVGTFLGIIMKATLGYLIRNPPRP